MSLDPEGDAYVIGYWAEEHGLNAAQLKKTSYASLCAAQPKGVDDGRKMRRKERQRTADPRPALPEGEALRRFYDSIEEVKANGGFDGS